MGDWNELFRDEVHILREPDLSVIRFARVMRDQGAQRVLDWGAGAGRHVVYLTGLGFDVVGMDPSINGLMEARRWLESEQLTADLQLVEPDLIPAADASFAAVLSLYAIEHGERRDVSASLAEIRRVLRPGGLALINLTSGEDSMRLQGQQVSPGTYAPIEGPEIGIPHYLPHRTDIDELFAEDELLELDHYCSYLSLLEDDERVDAHWSVMFRKKGSN